MAQFAELFMDSEVLNKFYDKIDSEWLETCFYKFENISDIQNDLILLKQIVGLHDLDIQISIFKQIKHLDKVFHIAHKYRIKHYNTLLKLAINDILQLERLNIYKNLCCDIMHDIFNTDSEKINIIKYILEFQEYHVDINDFIYNKNLLDYGFSKKINGIINTQSIAKKADFDVVQYLYDINYPYCGLFCLDAAEHGRVDILQFIYLHYGYHLISEIPEKACANGHLNVLQWAYNIGIAIDPQCLTHAVISGSIDIIEYLDNIGINICNNNPGFLALTAAQYGRLNVLQFLDTKNYNWYTAHIFSRSLLSGNVDLLNWLIIKCELIDNTGVIYWHIYDDNELQSLISGISKNINLFKWAILRGYTFDCDILVPLIENANLETFIEAVKYISPNSVNTNKKKLDISTTISKLYNSNNKQIFYWMYVNAKYNKCLEFITFDFDAIAKAAVDCNDLYGLIWAVENGGNMNHMMYLSAISNKNIEMLNWLYSNLCPTTDEKYTNKKTMEYLYEIKYDIKYDIKYAIKYTESAIKSGNLDTIKWVKQHLGWYEQSMKYNNKTHNFDTVIYAIALENGYLDIANWAISQSYIPDSDVWKYAAIAGRFDMLQWIINSGLHIDFDFDLKNSPYYPNIILKWSYTNKYNNFYN